MAEAQSQTTESAIILAQVLLLYLQQELRQLHSRLANLLPMWFTLSRLKPAPSLGTVASLQS